MDILDSIPAPNSLSNPGKEGILSGHTKAETNTANSNKLKEDIRKKLGSWYLQRHGVRADGNAEEMITLVQVLSGIILFFIFFLFFSSVFLLY